MQIISRNSHEWSPIADVEGELSPPVGTALFPLLSRFNHSCWPNAHAVKEGGRSIVVRATRRIKAGEEITTTYVDLHEPGRKRRRALWEASMFECRCERCADKVCTRRKSALRLCCY